MKRTAIALIGAGALTVAGAGIALAAGVTMVDDSFSPSQVTVAAGEAVTFANNGESPHTATADDGSFDTGTVEPGSSVSVGFDTPGTYPFYCQFHGGPGGEDMSGTITVTGGSGGTGGTDGDTGGVTGGATTAGTTGNATVGNATLPQTATPLPLIGAAGALMLGAGLWAARRREA